MAHVRILSGRYKGRRLPVPPIPELRPTCHRIRAALFNTLIHRFFPDRIGLNLPLSGLSVADLYAGTGAYGIEALSLGAQAVVFVESHPVAVDHLRASLRVLDATPYAKVLQIVWPGKGTPALDAAVDVLIMDPPYSLGSADLEKTLSAAANILKPQGLLVLEHPNPPSQAKGLRKIFEKRWGSKAAAFYTDEESCPAPKAAPQETYL